LTTLYAKRGHRYYPVHDTEAFNGLPNGSWLVVVRNGCRSIRRAVDDEAALERLAASVHLADRIAIAIVEHSRSEPAKRPLTAREKRAFKAWQDVMGEGAYLTMTRPSAREIGERVAGELLAEDETHV
jgi:hypothetical protein